MFLLPPPPPPPLLARWEVAKTNILLLIKESIDGIPFVMSRDVRLTGVRFWAWHQPVTLF